MSTKTDPRLAEAQSIPISEVVDRLAVPDLKRAGGELVGPCPKCGGTDRFGVNARRDVYNCRACGGGDGISLVRLVLDCSFEDALSWLVGAAPVEIDPEEERRRAALRAEKKRAADARAEKERQRAISAARAIWYEAEGGDLGMIGRYFVRRGLPAGLVERLSHCLRLHPDLPYMVPGESGGWIQAHRGPAMLAAVVDAGNRVTAVHRTWIDLDQPKGKAVVSHGGRVDWPAKKVLGHKKGCAIRLYTNRCASNSTDAMVMGEGIETTLTAMAADPASAAYWCGVDLGNMSGRRILRGKGMKYAGVPDLEDDQAFLPPPWVRRLIFIQDGDSEPKATRAKLEAGLRRARALLPSVQQIQIVHAGAGRDLNDILAEGSSDDVSD